MHDRCASNDKKPWPACPECGHVFPTPFDANDRDCRCVWFCWSCLKKLRRPAA